MQNISSQYSVSRGQKSEARGQNSEVRVQKSEVRGKNFRYSASDFEFRMLIVIWILFFGISFGGCSSSSSKPYDRSLVVTYAELTLLYEKEKMNNKVADSLYQVKVKEFFVEKGLQQDEFKKQIEELSEENETWKMFIQDVTTAMDSLTSVEARKR